MNTDELERELGRLVHDVSADGGFAAGVASKVRARKRARVAGVGVACVALLGLGAGVATQLPGGARTPTPATSGHALSEPTSAMTGPDGMPTRTVPNAPGDIAKGGLRLPGQYGGDRLAAGVIGDPGQRSVSVTWLPSTDRVSLTAECYLSGKSPANSMDVRVRASLAGGKGFLESGCDTSAPPGGVLPSNVWAPGEPGQGFPEISVGKRTTLVVQLVDGHGQAVTRPDARLAGAVYDQGPQQFVTDPKTGKAIASLPEVTVFDGYEYRLSALRVATPARQSPEVMTPEGVPFLVTLGSAGMGVGSGGPDNGADLGVRLEGLDADSPTIGNGAWTTVGQPARGAGTVHLVRDTAPPTIGADFIAIYTPEK